MPDLFECQVLASADMVYLTSDTHYNHKNIIKYCDRPFNSIEEMNESFIQRWNSVVRPEDLVYHLGDFGFGPIENLKPICQRLQGTKILIRGNHDRSVANMKAIGFNEVYNRLDCIYGKYPLVLRHKPIDFGEAHQLSDRHIVIHGHTHREKGYQLKYMNGLTQIDVGVDSHDYMPQSIDSILQEIKDLGCTGRT